MSWNDLKPESRDLAERACSAKQLAVLKLRLFHDPPLSWDQIAYRLNITDATVRGHYNAALRNIANLRRHEKEKAA